MWRTISIGSVLAGTNSYFDVSVGRVSEGLVFVEPKSEFLDETLAADFMHGYWAPQLVLVGLIAARPKLLLIVW